MYFIFNCLFYLKIESVTLESVNLRAKINRVESSKITLVRQTGLVAAASSVSQFDYSLFDDACFLIAGLMCPVQPFQRIGYPA